MGDSVTLKELKDGQDTIVKLLATGHELRNQARKEQDRRLESIELVTTATSGIVHSLEIRLRDIPGDCGKHAERLIAVEHTLAKADIPARCEKQNAKISQLQKVHWKLLGAFLVLSALLVLVGPKLLAKVWP